MAFNHETIGHYHILDTLARGARGYVYRAEDLAAHGMPVAVKLVESTPLRTESECNAFRQEVERIRLLQHAAIVPISDAGLHEATPYLVMPYLPGGSLLERLPRAGARSLPLETTLNVIAQVGAALRYAHQQQRAHSNLKPANILFDASGSALLADFALTSLLPGGRQYGVGVGNPLYMAPEQFRGFISPAGDQYALACIVYQMISGRPPFNANDFIALGFKHLSDAPVPPSQFNVLLPRPVEQAILRALAKQPDERFPDIAAFISALDMAGQASPAAGYAPAQALPETGISQKRPEDEDDEGDATIIRPLYGKKSPRAPRRSPKGAPVQYPATHRQGGDSSLPTNDPSAPVDPLPRLLEETLPADHPRRLSGAPNTPERLAARAAEIAADRTESGPLRDLSVIDTIRTNEVFDLGQMTALPQASIPEQDAPPLSVQQMVAQPAAPRKKRRLWFKLFGLLPAAALALGGTLPLIMTILHCLKVLA
jgi:serine/threonine protein kinase